MPTVLITIGVVGVFAVVAGNLVLVTARRRLAPAWAFTDPDQYRKPDPSRPRAPTLDNDARRHTRRSDLRWRRPPAWLGLFAVAFVFYAAIGGFLVLHDASIVGDAQSRVADAWYVLFSRDPHLAAVGFVWPPLPSLIELPVLLFKGLWPALATRGFASNLASAGMMAGSVVVLRGTLRDLGTRRSLAWVLVLAFALNPMIVYYGANGMAEAFQLFFLLVAVRYLIRWLDGGALAPLVWSAMGLGLAYLSRYEAGAGAAAGIAVVGAVAYSRARGVRKERLKTASSDLIVYTIPPAACFIGWSIISYVITGQPFQYASSQYGNSSQVALLGFTFTAKALGYPLPVFGGIQLLAFAPFLPILLGIVACQAWQRRDLRPLALLILLGVIGFCYLTFVTGTAFPWLRFYIPVVPLSMLCIAFMLADDRPVRRSRAADVGRSVALALLAIVLTVPAGVTTALAMNNPRFGSAEREYLAWVVYGRPDNADQRAKKLLVPSVNTITHEIDARHLPDSSVVADTFTPCVSMMVLNSNHPHQFVITSDRDFQRILADPPTFKALYLLAPPATLLGTLDAVDREYPNLYATGGGFARLIHTFHVAGCPPLRLFKVERSPRQVGG